ncbi:MAG: hypothetical protein U0452_05760 [Anaerolineae bacterium]
MPDTAPYLALGLAIVFSILGIYIGSLIVRFRRADEAEATLESLREPR